MTRALTLITIGILIYPQSLAAECGRFVAWVAPAKDLYFKQHIIYPIPDPIQKLARHYLPRLWIHPQSWHPIDFEDYLAGSKLFRKKDKAVIKTSPTAEYLASLSRAQQCDSYLDAGEIAPRNPAPIYIQAFRDENPADSNESWTYLKYNLVFDWSGLAAELSWLSRLGAWVSGGEFDRWHRLDIHLAAILAFDSRKRPRLLSLAQHNHQQTFLAGIDFPDDQRPHLAAAVRSNELYLDDDSSAPARYRVVPFFSDVAYLIDPREKPRFRAMDVVYGRNAGGKEISLKPVFIKPKHPLADFAGLLAPPKRLLGRYIGRDGPPGYNYYAPPAYVSMVNFASMGYWREGDLELLTRLKTLIQDKNDFRTIDWSAMVALMRDRLAHAIRRQSEERINPIANHSRRIHKR